MATEVEIIIKGKKVPTAICFHGKELDKGAGSILVESEVRTDDGYREPAKQSYPIAEQLAWVDSNGISGAQVLRYLGEWFDFCQLPVVTTEAPAEAPTEE